MKIAVATFIYPAPFMADYAKDCLASLMRQTTQEFTLYVFNDGMEGVAGLLPDQGLVSRIIEATGSPVDIRRHAIRYLIDAGFDIIVFADIDDLFDANRVGIVAGLIVGGADVVVNELVLFGGGQSGRERLFETRLAEGSSLSLADITDGNCFGMSNTAIRISAIPDEIFERRDVTAFDWFFYSLVLAAGAKACFTRETTTFYRQHDNNIAAIRNLSDVNIVRGLEIKRQHFVALKNTYADQLQETALMIERDKLFQRKYCEAVRAAMLPQPFWWESIKTFRELGL